MPDPAGGFPSIEETQPADALTADHVHKPDRVRDRHGDGVNTGRADGSVGRVGYDRLAAVEVGGTRWLDTEGTGFGPAFNAVMLGDADEPSVWRALAPRPPEEPAEASAEAGLQRKPVAPNAGRRRSRPSNPRRCSSFRFAGAGRCPESERVPTCLVEPIGRVVQP